VRRHGGIQALRLHPARLYHLQLHMANDDDGSAAGVRPIGGYRSVHDLVLGRLRDAILNGDLAPDTRLKLRDLAAQLGVSPVPVQEALYVLELEGLVVRQPRRGVVVSELTPESVTSAYEMLGATTGLSARHAAARLTPGGVADLRRLIDEMEGLRAAGDRPALVHANRRFHERICAAYPNQWAQDTLRRLWNYGYRVERQYPRTEARLRQGEEEHRAIIEALAARDANRASRLVQAHAEAAGAALVRQMRAAAARHGNAGTSGTSGTNGERADDERTH
jgi:DNA-binding GntR family transcriptional regulator